MMFKYCRGPCFPVSLFPCFPVAGVVSHYFVNQTVLSLRVHELRESFQEIDLSESSAITAMILLEYLEGFHLARQKVLQSSADPLTRGHNLVNLFACKQALSILEEAEEVAENSELPGLKYLKERCFTGLGKIDKSVSTYYKLIILAPY